MDDLQIVGMEMPRLRPTMKKRKRRRFEPQWVKLSTRWIKALRRSRNASTYQLACAILVEAFRREQDGGEIVLSAKVTGMPRNSRRRAIKELVKLRLIKIRQTGHKASRVVSII
jgi:hypothetical protein